MTENASIPEKHLRKDDAYTIAQRGSWEFVTPWTPADSETTVQLGSREGPHWRPSRS
jgi:hypothetical protein